jgi:DNA replication protein DnaC
MALPPAAFFLRAITKRYEKGSVNVTRDRPLQEQVSIFGDDAVAAAVLDRLLNKSYPFLIQRKIYRMKKILGYKTLARKVHVE